MTCNAIGASMGLSCSKAFQPLAVVTNSISMTF